MQLLQRMLYKYGRSIHRVLEVDLPFAALMFKDKVEKAIAKNITRALAPPS